MADLASLKPAENSKKKKKRAGRGHAGYCGKTCGKGMNGQKARKSPDVRRQFEGGQTPMYRRLPKEQYMPSWNEIKYTVLNLEDLNNFGFRANSKVTPEILLEKKLIKKLENGGLKILGNGSLDKPLKIQAHAVSASAEAKIKEAGGSVELLD